MARQKRADDFRFEGFTTPNTTPVPDVVFDKLLARLGEAELKALLYIIRRTFEFKRDRDPISFNQFLRGITTRDGRVLDEGCGISSRTTLSTALKALEAKGIVLSEKGMDERGENETTIYRLRFKAGDSATDDDGGNNHAGVVRISYHPSTEFALPVVRNSYPQETVLQETGFNDRSYAVGVSHIPWTPFRGSGHTVQSLAAISAAVVLYIADASLTAILVGFFALAGLIRMLFVPTM